MYPEVRGRWEYKLRIGGTEYGSDEIIASPGLTINGGGDGYSVGNVVVSTLNASVILKGAMPDRNAEVTFSYSDGGAFTELGSWYIHDRNLKNGVLSFSADDALGFSDKEYDQPPEDYTDEDGVSHIFRRTVDTQLTLIESGLSAHCGSMSVERPDASVLALDIPTQSGLKMREALGYISAANGSNCYADITSKASMRVVMQPPGAQTISLTDDDYDSISVGSPGSNISQIVVSKNGTESPALSENETLEDYGIVQMPVGKYRNDLILKLVDPLIPDAKSEGKEYSTDTLPLWSCSGKNFGTEFSIGNCIVTKIYPYFTSVSVSGYSGTFYASSLSYRFTASGIFASISGSGKAESDADFSGENAEQVKRKLTVGADYGCLKISAKGSISSKGEGVTTELFKGGLRAVFNNDKLEGST